MIFLYPALVSGTVEPKILPAIAKTLEKYFLLQIQEGMTSGTIRIKAEWDGDKYSELQLESKIIPSGSLLLESSVYDQIYELEKLIRKLNDVISFNTDVINTGNKSVENSFKMIKSDGTVSDEKGTYQTVVDITKDLKIRRDEAKAKLESLRENYKELTEEEKNRLEKEKLEYQKAKDKEEKEKDARKSAAEKEKRHGSYKVSTVSGVDLQPTMGNVDVRIRYEGGPASGSVGLEKVGDKLTIAIGTQILPMAIKDFDSLQNVLLDDYFSNHFKTVFKSLTRSVLRTIVGKIEKQYHRLLGKDLIQVDGGKSQVYKNIFLAPHGFVDASTFRKKGDAPKFYSYTSAIVIFNKTDITYPDEENFFLNQTQVQRLFKMGWNSFCIVDKEREEMIFVTMLDGGSLHRIPFSYLFHSMGASDLYKDLDPLRKKVSAFFIKAPGSIKDLGMRLAKENKMYRSIKNYLMG